MNKNIILSVKYINHKQNVTATYILSLLSGRSQTGAIKFAKRFLQTKRSYSRVHNTSIERLFWAGNQDNHQNLRVSEQAHILCSC